MKTREQIEEKYKWDLSSYYKDEQDFEKDLEWLRQNKGILCRYENKLKKPKVIFECLNKSSQQSLILTKLYVYACLRVKENQADSQRQARLERVSALATQISVNNSFVDVELSALSDKMLQKLATDKNYPQYSEFFRAVIRDKKHTLSKAEERLLSLMSDFAGGFSDNFDNFDDADLKFDSVKDGNGKLHTLDHSNIILKLQSNDRTLRKNAIVAREGKYGEFNNFLASNYIANVKLDVFGCKIRKFSSCLQASLYSEDVDPKVYDMLISSVNQNLPLLHKYMEAKRKILGLDKIAIYDTFAPVVKFSKKYTYDQAFAEVVAATSVLGKNYSDLLLRAKNERWIDVMPNQNKDSGAYSWGAYGALPVVSLNFVGDTNSTFTLAHELGHCMHTYFSNQNQPQQKAGYTIFVAEVASTVNEMLLCEHLLSKAKSKKEKMYYLDYLLTMARTTIFRQTQFSEFEKIIHDLCQNDVPITKDTLNNTYFDLQKKYYGKKVAQPDEIKYEWSRIPHFYNSFYVYKYATGLICSMAITRKILTNQPNAVQNYLKFLSLGCSTDPVTALQIAGADLTQKQTFDDAFAYINQTLQRFTALIK